MPSVDLLFARVMVLFAPLLFAAALSVVLGRFRLLEPLCRPIDAGATLRGRRVFGDSKTWRGLVTAVGGCIIGVAFETILPIPAEARVVAYDAINPITFGGAMGLGALLGELPSSFVKRQLAVSPGAVPLGPARVLFLVWDQIDLLTGAWPCIAYWVHPDAALVCMSLVVGLLVHPLLTLTGDLLGIERRSYGRRRARFQPDDGPA